MKTVISFFIFSFFIIGANAQETTSKIDHPKKAEIIQHSKKDLSTSQSLPEVNITATEEDICYGEISKVTFYEALIRQNNFDIDLKESDNIALKNTEDIIKNRKNRISYTE